LRPDPGSVNESRREENAAQRKEAQNSSELHQGSLKSPEDDQAQFTDDHSEIAG
jgi:hypothetical protein